MGKKELKKAIEKIKKKNEPEEELEAPEYEEEEEDDEEEEEEEKKLPKLKAKREEITIAEQVASLQNDGLFRLELLHRLQELNKSIEEIKGLLKDEEE